ncbi:hypothetical protein L484_027167 [Morus notabilis]|uniref:Uncharacterized protein n=1 Tax=Morus notabilis TaxID=981085 RepID=W9SBQ1_9ROSA|nr:hypothetical protein L484_027167 [Morus notabilis]
MGILAGNMVDTGVFDWDHNDIRQLGNDQLNFSSGSPTRKKPQIGGNGNNSNWDNSSLNGLNRARDQNDVKMFPSSTVLEITMNVD